MSIQYVPIPSTPVTGTNGSEQTLLTATTNGVTKLTSLEVTNVTGSPETLTVYLVPDGGSVGTGTKIINVMDVGANDTVPVLSAALLIGAGATLRFAASTASSLNLFGDYQIRT